MEISRWGQMHQEFLRRLLPFRAGVPSHDTLNDVINAIDGTLFAQCFTVWVEGLREPTPICPAVPEIVAIDGKTSRRSHDRSKDRGPLHMVSAWASSQRLVLGQQACEAKSNEITAIPLLLERLAITGALVTIDAMGTQTKIAQAILDRGGDHLLALKDNQTSLYDEVRHYLDDHAAQIHSRFENDRWRPMAASRSVATWSATKWTGSPPPGGSPANRGFQALVPSPWSRPRSSATAAPVSNGATTCHRGRSTSKCSPTPCDAIGMSRTVSTGSSTWCSRVRRKSAAWDTAYLESRAPPISLTTFQAIPLPGSAKVIDLCSPFGARLTQTRE